jgi:hypothetical protein
MARSKLDDCLELTARLPREAKRALKRQTEALMESSGMDHVSAAKQVVAQALGHVRTDLKTVTEALAPPAPSELLYAKAKPTRFVRSMAELERLSKEQEAFKEWYEKFQAWTEGKLGKYAHYYPLMAQVMAATSPNTSVPANVPKMVAVLRSFIKDGR